jgi:hypothetical protein
MFSAGRAGYVWSGWFEQGGSRFIQQEQLQTIAARLNLLRG